MAQVPVQGFSLGDRAWFADGRSGLITRTVFNPLAGEWSYDVEGLGGLFLESDLFNVNPIVDAPPVEPEPEPVPAPKPTGDFVTRDELAAVVARVNSSFETAAELRGALREDLEDAMAGLASALTAARADLRNEIVTQQREIGSRLDDQDTAADESGDGGTPGFFRRVGAFITAPFASILDAVGEFILAEVRSGLNQRRS